MDEINFFISELSTYYRHENDLSNITVALCNSCSTFRDIFVRFFFPKIDLNDIDEIRREVPDECGKGSRVDIYISMRSDDNPYVIEVKIYDTNHHFGQYEAAYNIPSERLGYITNYQMQRYGYTIHTWEEFYKHLHKYKSFGSNDDQNMIEGYLSYLQNVCNLEIFNTPMNLNGIYSLYEFTNIALQALYTENDNYSSQPIKQYQPIHSGKILGVNIIDFNIYYPDRRRKPIYGWLSLYYSTAEPSIYIAIPEPNNQSTHPHLFDDTLQEAGKQFNQPFLDCDEAWGIHCLWFEYKHMIKLNNSDTIEEQKKLINAYIQEVFDYVFQH